MDLLRIQMMKRRVQAALEVVTSASSVGGIWVAAMVKWSEN